MREVIFSSEDEHEVTETSKQSYQEISEDGTKKTQKQQVREALRAMGGDASINELAHEALAGMQKSSISGRLNDLKDDGIVKDFPESKRQDKYSGKKVKPWRLMVI